MANALTLFQGFQREYPELASQGTPGYVESIRSSRVSSWLNGTASFFTAPSTISSIGSSSLSNSELSDVVSQVTVPGMMLGSAYTQPTSASSGRLSSTFPVNPAGLAHDAEAKETRKAMLARRRQECESDEVAVAMAPVYKINTSYMFYPDQYKRFRTMFPRVTPDPGLSFTHHDHPVAHTATMVGIRHIQQHLSPGKTYLDINGNPNGNEAYNRFQASRTRRRPGLPASPRIETMVYPHSAQDSVRQHTKWGDQHGPDGATRYVVDRMENIPNDVFDGFVMIHTLYYYTMLDITKLLAKNKRTTIKALVNYSPEQSGVLYGELKFSKADGMTVQTSPNGESYRHPDVDQWFQTQSFKYCPETGNDFGAYGISWTSRNIGGPLYEIEIAHCPGHLARTQRYDPPLAPTLQVSKGAYFSFVRVGGNDVQLRISNHELASELRHFMVMRDRANPQTLADLGVKARRVTAPDLVSGTRQYRVNDGELFDHIVYAYLVDAPGELELLEGVKLLRGDLLMPHAEALKLDGKDKVDSFFGGLCHALSLTRESPVVALGGRASRKPLGFKPPNQNSGGLLTVART